MLNDEETEVERAGAEYHAKRKALIISVSDYDSKLQSLPFCKNDGQKMHELLKSLGYEIPDKYVLIGRVNHEVMKKAIQNFFTREVKSKDTLLFYFSGHGIPEDNGINYLATSEIDPEEPYDKGYQFEDLQRMMDRSVSTRKVVMLDCCYSGAARPGGKGGNEEEAANLGREAINKTIKAGEGKCVLASSLSYQKSYASKKQEHSIFTYYLMDGLKGNRESVNSDGSITPDTLGRYVYDKVTEKFPKQKPIRKVEASGDIILAQYPKLAQKHEMADVSSIIYKGQEYIEGREYDDALECFEEAISINPNSYVAYIYKGDVFLKKGKHEEAITAFNKAISISPNDHVAYNHKGDVLVELSKYEEAVTCYNKALTIKPRYFDVLKDRGLALSNLGRYDEAIESYNMALEIDKNAQVWYYKGSALQKAGNKRDAIYSYDQALAISPTYDEATKARESVIEGPRKSDLSYYKRITEPEWGVLIRSIEKGYLIPFIGPLVYGDLLPTPENISRRWADKYDYPLDDSYSLPKVAHFLQVMHKIPPKVLLSEELQRIELPNFDLPDYENSPYAILAELPFPTYITTNYDYLMEKALKDKRRNPVSEFCRWDPDAAELFDFEPLLKKSKYTPAVEKPLVYHLHGVLDKPDSMVLTEKDYTKFVVNLNKESDLLPPPVESALERTSLLFVGCSPQDIMSPIIFGTTMKLSKRPSSNSSLILQLPNLSMIQNGDQGIDYLIRYAEKMYNLHAYSYDTSEFFRELGNRWRRR